MNLDVLRHHRSSHHTASAFGSDRFGQAAERFARFFGTPKFLVGQTIVVGGWIIANVVGVIHHWDPYPFILLNLLFSTQAAYAAPLILLAQTRQADRDKALSEADARHREELAANQIEELERNTALTIQVHQNTVWLNAIAEHLGVAASQA